ncbi:XRE family transcriptional regulator [Pedobacter duraquae]|uniref:Uncharacterized protein n=1 Tax=Pedobacter duraquae TaxID=425511 RepID=A0A4R6IIU3_9SPHI|nr:XRE family transcriptional regulator [Pedobacter duraquae]TDO21912.1 hypothetical protein CLV32_3020 [Pedobacter duraquae]
MRKIVFIVEKTDTGFSAYADDFENIPAATTADTLGELKTNALDAFNTIAELKGLEEANIDDIVIQLDLPQLFEYYKIINASALGARIGMDKTLLSQYVNGHKKAGPKQVQKIICGIRELGSELASLELA